MRITQKNRHAALPDGRHNITGKRIQQIRIESGITQAQLVKRLRQQGVIFAQKQLSNIETGQRAVTDFELLAIADGLGVDVVELYKPATTIQRPPKPEPEPKPSRQIDNAVLFDNLEALEQWRSQSYRAKAERCGVGYTTVSRIMQRKGCSYMETVKKLADGLGVDVSDLIKKPSTKP